jgi:hypothetical protein
MNRDTLFKTWPEIDENFAREVVRDAMRRYFAARRERLGAFIDRHFTVAGSAALHRKAFGWDLLRAPANLLLALPHAGAKLAAAGLDAVGAEAIAARLRARRLLLETAVGREIQWVITTELLELPCQEGERVSSRDALAETILSDPRIESIAHEVVAALRHHTGDETFRRRLEATLATYADSRAAAADITTGLLTLSVGAVTLQKITPGAMTLGPALAATMAQQAAVASFPLGSTLGGLWYGVFPVTASPALIAGFTGGLALGAASLAAFAGILADPLQRRLGLHRRRLNRFLDALERQWVEGVDGTFIVRDHYTARLLDLLDLLAGAWRLART